MQHIRTTHPDVLCIGSCGWDILGIADGPMGPGEDVPGRITSVPGGVAYNICRHLQSLAVPAALASVIGVDALGNALMDAVEPELGDASYILRSSTATAHYLALESPEGLFGAVANTMILEERSIALLDHAHQLRTVRENCRPITLIDGNLAAEAYAHLRNTELFAGHRIVVAAASPVKADRLRQVCPREATIYANRKEAVRICDGSRHLATAMDAAEALCAMGFVRAIVTDGPHPVADVCADWSVMACPGGEKPARWTGAGDRFLAHHMACDAVVDDPGAALQMTCHQEVV